MLIDSVIVTDTGNVNVINTMKVYFKLFIIIAFAVLLSTVGLVSSNEVEARVGSTVDSVQHPALVKMVKMRCTRRFSPGVCVDNVAPVWTFVFLQQNCTERLGCPNNYRSNRFRSYKMCMKHCRALMEMYLKMLEFEDKIADTNVTLEDSGVDTDDRNLREGFDEHLPASGSTKFPLDLVYPGEDDEEEEYKGSEQDTRFVVYKDRSVNEDIMPADVDYVPGEIRSEVIMQW